MRNRCVTSAFLAIVIAGGACSAAFAAEDAVGGASHEPSLLFQDDFSSGDFSKHNDYFRWGRSGSIPKPTGESSTIERLEEGPAGEPVHAMRFRYRGKDHPDGPGRWQEVRFHLTRSADEQRDGESDSEVAYPEVWISYWMKVPANYHHAAGHGGNQKGWLYLWKDRYEKWSGGHEDDATVTPTSASLHWWPTGDEGRSRATLVHSRERKNWGHKSPSFVAEERRLGPNHAAVFLEEEQGKWVHFTFGMKAASDAESNDGFARVYVNGELAIAWENLSGGSDDPAENGYDRGYILGYHNAIYPEDTTYYITDFRFATGRDALGVELSD